MAHCTSSLLIYCEFVICMVLLLPTPCYMVSSSTMPVPSVRYGRGIVGTFDVSSERAVSRCVVLSIEHIRVCSPVFDGQQVCKINSVQLVASALSNLEDDNISMDKNVIQRRPIGLILYTCSCASSTREGAESTGAFVDPLDGMKFNV